MAQQLYEELEYRIGDQLQAFIGMTVFEELCQEWVLTQARNRKLPFPVEQVGSHWGGDVQIDVVAINWREKAILLGEAKWRVEAVGRQVIRELIEEKTPKLLRYLSDEGQQWQVYYAFFARGEFTEAARKLAHAQRAILVELSQLDRDLLAASLG